ncbi:unnamed protein product [Arabidopsis halleri]
MKMRLLGSLCMIWCSNILLSTMWAWLFGEEGFDIGKEKELMDTCKVEMRNWIQGLRSFGC